MFIGHSRRHSTAVVTNIGSPLDGASWFTAPSDNPTLPQTNMDTFSPTTQAGSPNSSAPIIGRITAKAAPNGCVWASGYQFDDTMALYIYGEVAGVSGLYPSQMLARTGNTALFRLSASLPNNSFMLAWILHPTYGYSEPYPINAPEVFALHGSYYGLGSIANQSAIVVRVGDSLHVGGINLSSQQGTERCWAYFSPTGGGAGTWAVATSVSDAHSVFTVPSLSNGTYYVWIHSGRGGLYGWHRARSSITVAAAETLQSDKAVAPPTGVSDGTILGNARAQIGGNNTGFIVMQPGVYQISSEFSLLTGGNGRCHLKGSGMNVTTLKLSSFFNTGSMFTTSNGFCWMEDMTVDVSDLVGTITHAPGVPSCLPLINGFSRLKNVRIKTGSRDDIKCINNCNMMDGCEIEGGEGSYPTGSPVFGSAAINSVSLAMNSTWILRNGAEGMVFSAGGASNVGIYNVTLSEGTPKQSAGRFYIRGVDCKGTVIANCTTVNLGSHLSDQNKGEQILFDGGYIREDYIANGGTSTTITIDAVAATLGFAMRSTTTGSSANATSATPTFTFPNAATNTRFTHVDIVSGTNAIVGRYAISGRSGNNLTLAGAIGTNATLSNVTANGMYFPREAFRGGISSSNATSSTPTISATVPFAADDVNRIIYFSSGTNFLNITAKITAVAGGIATLDRAIGTVASVSGGGGNTFEGYNPSLAKFGVTVKGGKGVGQFASITSTTASGANIVLTLDRPFRISTDSTSYIQIWLGSMDTALYNNTLAGDGAQVTAGSGASCGLESFSPNAGMYMWGGSITGLRYGIVDWAPGVTIIDHQSCSVWNYFAVPSITNCSYMTRNWSGTNADVGQEIALSLSIWTDIAGSGHRVAQSWLANFGATDTVCFNNVTATGNAPLGISVDYSNAGKLYLNNCSFALGSGTFSGSRITTAGSPVTISQFNPSSGQFTGFQS